MRPTQPSNNDQQGTPPRPPYSPVTPILSHEPTFPTGGDDLGPLLSSPSPTSPAAPYTPTARSRPVTFAPEPAPQPPPVPISESENPDAIALRSAISILQMQKQKSLRDIKTLERMKSAMVVDPEGFARELAAGNLSARDDGNYIDVPVDEEEDGDEDEESASNGTENSESKFGAMPTPQNVVRMPPVNWAKYQIVGESLDKIHEDQRRRPPAGEPRREEYTHRPPEHFLASPYRPLVDQLESPEHQHTDGASNGKKP